jgi:hypothetical protein
LRSASGGRSNRAPASLIVCFARLIRWAIVDSGTRKAFAISAGAIALPFFAAFLVGGVGYFMRLFALYVATKSQ